MPAAATLPPPTTAPARWPAPAVRWRQLRPATRRLAVVVVLAVTAMTLEGACRVYWGLVNGRPFHVAGDLWRKSFPEFEESGLSAVAPFHGNDTFDVLLLGASTLHQTYGDIAGRLGPHLEARLGRPVRVINLAWPARTTRDDRFKYEHLAEYRWDLVLVYEGINDTFFNNCPPGTFRADYSHDARYAQFNAYERHPEARWLTLPLTAEAITIGLRHRLGRFPYPRPEWARYGADVRTPPAFEANLDAIAALAARRGDPLVLMTFAYHLPAGYSRAAFLAGELDYGRPVLAPAEMWGEPANLARAMDLHNDAVRRVARRHGTLFIDQRALLPGRGEYFRDPCHLTGEGCRRFVDNVVANLDLTRVGHRAE